MTVALLELLAEVGSPMAEGIVIVSFLTGIFSCFDVAWLFSWVGGIEHCLVTSKLPEAGTVEGHRVEALVGFVVMGVVVDVLATGIAGSMWGFSTLHTLYCFLTCPFSLFLPCHFVPSAVMVLKTFRDNWGSGKGSLLPGPSALDRSSSSLLGMDKDNGLLPGLAGDYLGRVVSPEQVDTFHGSYCHFHMYGVLWQLTLEISIQEVALWSQYTRHLKSYLYVLYSFLIAGSQCEPCNPLF